MTISEPGMPAELYRLARTTAGFFGMLRTSPILGRVFSASDETPGAPPVAILGYQVWLTRYNGSPDVIGRQIRVNEQPTTVIGVMPPGLPDAESRGRLDSARARRQTVKLAIAADCWSSDY